MAQRNHNQSFRQPINETVNQDVLTVEHWRERFARLIVHFTSVPVAADKLGAKDDYFSGGSGYVRLHNVASKRAGLKTTARAVKGIEELLGPDVVALSLSPTNQLMKSQKLVRRSAS